MHLAGASKSHHVGKERGFITDSVPQWYSSGQLRYGRLHTHVVRWAPQEPIWLYFLSIFPSVELRCISHSDVAARGAEVKSRFLLFRIWKLLVQRNCTKWEVDGEGGGTRTGNANKQQHLSPSKAQWAGCQVCWHYFAAMFIFLMLLF